jgi:large subunit ribosomal protein L15
VGDLEAVFDAGDEITLEALKEKSLAKHRFDILKILGDGELTKKLKVSAHRFSKSAREKIEKAGGEVIVIPGRTPVEDKKKQKKLAKASS